MTQKLVLVTGGLHRVGAAISARLAREGYALAIHKRSPGEADAVLVRRILEEAGIPVIIRSRQVPGYGDVIQKSSGVWADVLVPVAYEAAAREYVTAYLGQMKEERNVSRLAGIVPPLVTLFDRDGRIDKEANREHVDRLLAGGVHGVFALGSTGETMHLTAEERRTFAALIVRSGISTVRQTVYGCVASSGLPLGFAAAARKAGFGERARSAARMFTMSPPFGPRTG